MAPPFTIFYRLGVPEQALGGIPLGFGIVVEDKPSELSRTAPPISHVKYALALTINLQGWHILYMYKYTHAPYKRNRTL